MGAWGASWSPDKGSGEVVKVLGAGGCQSQVGTWSCLCTLPANLPHPPGSTYPTYPTLDARVLLLLLLRAPLPPFSPTAHGHGQGIRPLADTV